MEQTLDQLKQGQSACVAALTFTGPKRGRMLDLGFIPGGVVTAVQESPFGDPVAYQVLDTVIALRRSDAKQIIIT